MSYPDKRNSYPGFKNGTAIATHQDKLKQFFYQLKSVFATKIQLKDQDLEQKIGNFFILDVQNYLPLKQLMIMKYS